MNGVKDTQAVESTFSAVKRFIRRKFPRRKPKLSELDSALINFFDQGSEERDQSIKRSTLRFQHSDPLVKKSLDKAAVHLNDGGFRRLIQEVKAALAKHDNMELTGDTIKETYTGKETCPYVGTYKTDGFTCNCSWFRSYKICRHVIHFRKKNDLPLFDLRMFHNSFRKIDYQEDEWEENKESLDSVGFDTDNPGSPGMEQLIEEQQNKAKKIKPNVKYNKVYEATKPLTDYLSLVEQDSFLCQVETVKQFTELVRRGLPSEVVNVIEKQYKLAALSPNTNTNDIQSAVNISAESSYSQIGSQSQTSHVKPVRLENRDDVQGWNLIVPSQDIWTVPYTY